MEGMYNNSNPLLFMYAYGRNVNSQSIVIYVCLWKECTVTLNPLLFMYMEGMYNNF